MPRPEDGHALKPIEPIGASEVPRAGLRELAIFKQGQEGAKASLTMWTLLSAVFAALAVTLAPEGFIAYGLFMFMAMACGSTAAATFWRLARAKSWQSLPEGATETTALLEDGLSKSIREWNMDAQDWNRKLASLETDAALWRGKLEDPSKREEGWSQASHDVEAETLLARGKALMIERRGLNACRRRIRRSIQQLEARMRRAERESQEPDPETR